MKERAEIDLHLNVRSTILVRKDKRFSIIVLLQGN